MSAVIIGAAALAAVGALNAQRNFTAWFGDSKVVDENGRPLVVYHGTSAEVDPSFAFRRVPGAHMGFHFGTAKAASDKLEGDRYVTNRAAPKAEYIFPESERNDLRHALYDRKWEIEKEIARIMAESVWQEQARSQAVLLLQEERVEEAMAILHGLREDFEGDHDAIAALEAERYQIEQDMDNLFRKVRPGEKIIPVYLRIERPIDANDGNWGDIDVIREKNKDVPAIANAKAKDMNQLQRWLIRLGYDGVRYVNKYEDPGSVSWIAFHPEQIKSATGNRGTFSSRSESISMNRV
jgi:hypothetical protein